jgi:hypothetical protein
MGQMLKLETLIAHFATPISFPSEPITSNPARVITHSTLAQFHLSSRAEDCTLALTHLILPALTSLRVDAISERSRAEDVRALIPCFARHAHGPQDVEPLQSMIISGGPCLTEIISWTEPDADLAVNNSQTLNNATLTARAIFTIAGPHWRYGTDSEIFEATLAALPLSSLTGLTAQHTSHFPRTLWLNQGPRWPSLDRVRLVDFMASMPFTNVLTKDAPWDGPLLPSLTKVYFVGLSLTEEHDGDHLIDMLIVRVEQGVPLETLDLRACSVTASVVRLLGEITVHVLGPEDGFLPTALWPTLTNWRRDFLRIFYHEEDDIGDEDSEVFSDDLSAGPWFDDNIDEYEDDDEDDDDYDDGDEDDGDGDDEVIQLL